MSSESNAIEARLVRLTLSARHDAPMPNLSAVSLFDGLREGLIHTAGLSRRDTDGPVEPEDYPDEMADAVNELYTNSGTVPPGDYLDPEADGEDDPVLELEDRIAALLELFGIEQDEDDSEGSYVFQTSALLTHRPQPDGTEWIEVSYQEADTMEHTKTTVRYSPACPDMVTVYRTGDVITMLVCEKGRRHISAYETPLGPFEVAVYAREVSGSLSFPEGGALTLDYVVEIRGMEVQRTRMNIQVI